MSWLLLALSLAAFCVAWSVHSPLLMALGLLVALAALAAFAWVRYKLLFPARTVAIEDTPLTADDVRRMRDAQLAASAAAPMAPALPAASQPTQEQMRAAALRVTERDALLKQQEEAQHQLAEMERRAAEAEERAREMEQRLADLQREALAVVATPATSPEPVPAIPAADTNPIPAPPSKPPPQPNLREEGWNPYAGEVQVPPKRPFDAKAAGLDVPMLTPLRDDPDPT